MKNIINWYKIINNDANPHAFCQIATFDTALSNDPSFKDAWGPRKLAEFGGGKILQKVPRRKKKTHRRAVGVFCESAPAALEPSGPKKNQRTERVSLTFQTKNADVS